MELKLRFSIGMVLAVVVGEAVSLLFYSESMPWRKYRSGERYLVTALLADFGLAFIFSQIMSGMWGVHGWESGAILSFWITLLFTCLEAPHVVRDQNSCTRFFVHVLHKFCMTFAMIMTLMFFWHY